MQECKNVTHSFSSLPCSHSGRIKTSAKVNNYINSIIIM